MKKIILVFVAVMTMATASASQNDLGHWIESEVSSHQYVLAEIERTHPRFESLLATIRVRLRATLSVEIPLLAKGKFRPEIELYFTR